MDREAWRAVIHAVAKSWARLSDWTDWLTDVYREEDLKRPGVYCIFLSVGMWEKETERKRERQTDRQSLHYIKHFSICWLSHTCACWEPMDHSLPGSSVHGILQARILDWLPCPPPRDLLDPGIKPGSLTSPAFAGFFTASSTWEAHLIHSTQRHFITCVSWFTMIGYSGNLEDTSKCRGFLFPFSES